MIHNEYARTIENKLRLQNLAWYFGSIAADRQQKKVIEMPKRDECGCIPCSNCNGEGFVPVNTSEILLDCPKCGTTGFVVMCNKHWDEQHSSEGFQQTGLPESFFK